MTPGTLEHAVSQLYVAIFQIKPTKLDDSKGDAGDAKENHEAKGLAELVFKPQAQRGEMLQSWVKETEDVLEKLLDLNLSWSSQLEDAWVNVLFAVEADKAVFSESFIKKIIHILFTKHNFSSLLFKIGNHLRMHYQPNVGEAHPFIPDREEYLALACTCLSIAEELDTIKDTSKFARYAPLLGLTDGGHYGSFRDIFARLGDELSIRNFNRLVNPNAPLIRELTLAAEYHSVAAADLAMLYHRQFEFTLEPKHAELTKDINLVSNIENTQLALKQAFKMQPHLLPPFIVTQLIGVTAKLLALRDALKSNTATSEVESLDPYEVPNRQLKLEHFALLEIIQPIYEALKALHTQLEQESVQIVAFRNAEKSRIERENRSEAELTIADEDKRTPYRGTETHEARIKRALHQTPVKEIANDQVIKILQARLAVPCLLTPFTRQARLQQDAKVNNEARQLSWQFLLTFLHSDTDKQEFCQVVAQSFKDNYLCERTKVTVDAGDAKATASAEPEMELSSWQIVELLRIPEIRNALNLKQFDLNQADDETHLKVLDVYLQYFMQTNKALAKEDKWAALLFNEIINGYRSKKISDMPDKVNKLLWILCHSRVKKRYRKRVIRNDCRLNDLIKILSVEKILKLLESQLEDLPVPEDLGSHYLEAHFSITQNLEIPLANLFWWNLEDLKFPLLLEKAEQGMLSMDQFKKEIRIASRLKRKSYFLKLYLLLNMLLPSNLPHDQQEQELACLRLEFEIHLRQIDSSNDPVNLTAQHFFTADPEQRMVFLNHYLNSRYISSDEKAGDRPYLPENPSLKQVKEQVEQILKKETELRSMLETASSDASMFQELNAAIHQIILRMIKFYFNDPRERGSTQTNNATGSRFLEYLTPGHDQLPDCVEAQEVITDHLLALEAIKNSALYQRLKETQNPYYKELTSFMEQAYQAIDRASDQLRTKFAREFHKDNEELTDIITFRYLLTNEIHRLQVEMNTMTLKSSFGFHIDPGLVIRQEKLASEIKQVEWLLQAVYYPKFLDKLSDFVNNNKDTKTGKNLAEYRRLFQVAKGSAIDLSSPVSILRMA